jgi:hypothetical protein
MSVNKIRELTAAELDVVVGGFMKGGCTDYGSLLPPEVNPFPPLPIKDLFEPYTIG